MRLLILFIIIMASVSLQAQSEITLEDIWKEKTFDAKSVPGFNFMKDGRHYTRREKSVIKKYDLLSGDWVEDLLDGAEIKDQDGFSGKIDSYTFNEDETKMLIKSDSEKIYRHSSRASYHLYDRASKTLKAVSPDKKIMNASFSPNGMHIAYAFENNLYVWDPVKDDTKEITSDGEKNKIINGITDWVYEEEFAFVKAFFWSADSKKIAFIRFDETEVPEFTMTNYRDGLYPEYVTWKYPKVGSTNATVSAHIYDVDTGKKISADIGPLEDMYIPRMKWTKDPNTLCIFKMNRHQNELDLHLVDASTGKSTVLLNEKNKYYINITDDLTFLEDGKHFIWTSEMSGYKHVYLYDLKGKQKKALTSGDYDVTRLYGLDKKRKKIYYQAAERSPMERQVYSVDLSGRNKKLVTNQPGTNSAQFSSTYDYFVWNKSEINKPAEYHVFDHNIQKVRTLEDNKVLIGKQKSYGVEPVEFFDFTTSEGVDLNGWMIKPANFNPQEKYPVFMFLYGGPGSQQVNDTWKGANYWWFQMLAQRGYLIACVDNRGTGARGEEFKKSTYLQLGHYETIDQIEAAKYLGTLPYTDAERIGIFGWSYGGYMSSLCILKGADVFKAAIAVAPVTNWKWYDTVYTERYMRTEKENEKGYADNSPVYFADQLEGNYLLVHGLGDDNVHFQHTAEMANALIKANKQFDTYYYPNRAHGIRGDNARLHLFTKMTDFVLNKI